MEKEVTAKFKYIRISPLKLRRIVNLVRGKNCKESLALLGTLPHKAARIVEKIIKSCVSNAKKNHQVKGDGLVISRIFSDSAGMLKRVHAQSRGRAAPIKHRISHLTIFVKLAGAGQPAGREK